MGKTGNLWTLAHAEGLSHAKVDEIREDRICSVYSKWKPALGWL